MVSMTLQPGPQITSVTRIQKGGRITISGSGFGTTTDHLTVLFNGVPCTDIVMSQPSSIITCVVPMQGLQGSDGAVSGSLAVNVSGRSAHSLVFFDKVVLTLKAWGAGGGGGEHTTGNHGGGGGFATARYAALPGEVLHVVVGRGGRCAPDDLHRGGGGAPNGGHGGANYEAGGGGITARRFWDAVVLGAGGGGGGSGGYHCGAGGGGGGGTRDGVVGKGGMGSGQAADPPGSTKECGAGQNGGGGGGTACPCSGCTTRRGGKPGWAAWEGESQLQEVKCGGKGVDGVCGNGAGGLGGENGGGGGGGAASCTHVIEGTFITINARGQEGANWGDPDSTKANGNKAGRGGNHGEDGRAVIVVEGSGKCFVFDNDGDFTVAD
ncbi:hypothetical protein Pelo_19110 [Pelomyxa schiedti]|nr:hypothetical protein Pelo_19110 [Pelomyxa schiedti]